MTELAANLKRAIKRRISLAIGRFILTAIDDSGTDRRGRESHQRVSGTIFKGEDLFEDIARLQDYGISSHPLPGAEGIALAVGGSRARLVVINTDDPRSRPVDLVEGEVQIYTDEGPVLHAKRSRETELRGTSLDAEFSGTAKVQGATLDLDGTVAANIDGALITAAAVGANTITGATVVITASGAVTITGGTINIVGTATIDGKAWASHTHTVGSLTDSTPAPCTGVTGPPV